MGVNVHRRGRWLPRRPGGEGEGMGHTGRQMEGMMLRNSHQGKQKTEFGAKPGTFKKHQGKTDSR